MELEEFVDPEDSQDVEIHDTNLIVVTPKSVQIKQALAQHRCNIFLGVIIVILCVALAASLGLLLFPQQTTIIRSPSQSSEEETRSFDTDDTPVPAPAPTDDDTHPKEFPTSCVLNPQCGCGCDPPRKHQQNLIAASREYQVKLDMKDWENRTAGVMKYLDAINSVSTLNLQLDDIIEHFHDEYRVDGKKCIRNNSYFRIRHYYYPENLSYNTTIDLKANGNGTYESAIAFPMWPVDSLVKNSTQKCENDFHYDCYDKFSRETRIRFGNHKMFTVCSDLASLFPWAMTLRSTELLIPTPIIDEPVYWYLGKSTGNLTEHTLYELEFTIMYDSLAHALENAHRSAGEVSMRIYALDDGLSPSHSFEPAGVTEAVNIWDAMVNITDAKQCFQ